MLTTYSKHTHTFRAQSSTNTGVVHFQGTGSQQYFANTSKKQQTNGAQASSGKSELDEYTEKNIIPVDDPVDKGATYGANV